MGGELFLLTSFFIEPTSLSVNQTMHANKERVRRHSVELEGSPAWALDGQSITVAANDHGIPHLYSVAPGGGPPVPFLREYSLDPTWSPDGGIAVCSGPDIGTLFSVKAATADAAGQRLPPLTLTRGSRHLVFVDDSCGRRDAIRGIATISARFVRASITSSHSPATRLRLCGLID